MEARTLDQARKDAGFDQAALDEAARHGFANGAFEDLVEDVPAVVEEFYPAEAGVGGNGVTNGPAGGNLQDRLENKVARLGTG